MDKSNFALGVALVAIVIAIGGYFYPQLSTAFGGVTKYDELDATAIKIGGTNGSRVGPIISTTCSLIADSSIAATSTGNADCAVTGVVSGDTVFAQLAASTTLASQFVVKSAAASTTAGFVTLKLLNLTGTAATPSATNGFGSSTAVFVLHPVSSVPGL